MIHSSTILKLMVVCLGLVILAIAGWMIVMAVRRSLLHGNEPSEGIGFSLRDLEKMYQRGELTEAEFKNIKRKRALKAAGYTDVPSPMPSKKMEPPERPTPPGQ